MKDFKIKHIDLDYLLQRDEIIKYLLDSDRHYTLYDTKKIRYYLRILLKYLKKGDK